MRIRLYTYWAGFLTRGQIPHRQDDLIRSSLGGKAEGVVEGFVLEPERSGEKAGGGPIDGAQARHTAEAFVLTFRQEF